MKNLLMVIAIFGSFSAYAGKLACYHSHSKPVCGYLVEDEQTRSCRVDIFGRNNESWRTVESIYVEGSYEATDNKVVKYFRIKQTEKAIAKKLEFRVNEIRNSINSCAY